MFIKLCVIMNVNNRHDFVNDITESPRIVVKKYLCLKEEHVLEKEIEETGTILVHPILEMGEFRSITLLCE